VGVRVTRHIRPAVIREIDVPHRPTIFVKLTCLRVATISPFLLPKLGMRVITIWDGISILVTGQWSIWEPIPIIVMDEDRRGAGYHIVRVGFSPDYGP
jgi:hypothetical protein